MALVRALARVIETDHPELGPAGAIQLFLGAFVGRLVAHHDRFRGTSRLN